MKLAQRLHENQNSHVISIWMHLARQFKEVLKYTVLWPEIHRCTGPSHFSIVYSQKDSENDGPLSKLDI